MDLNMDMRQSQNLSPQVIQTLKVLQMGSQELLEYIGELALENPVVDVYEIPPEAPGKSDLQKKLEWLSSTDVQNRAYYQPDGDGFDAAASAPSPGPENQTLCQHLLFQLGRTGASRSLLDAAAFIIKCLDGSGRLEEEPEELAQALGRSTEDMLQALKLVQSLEPAGVGARDLSQCLCLQLERQEPVNTLALAIAREHLDDLSKNHFGLLGRALDASQEEIRAACGVIRSLNPRPGADFAPPEAPVYITPDIIVEAGPEGFQARANDSFFPNLSISNYYDRMLRESGDEELREYLTKKIRQAKWVMHSIEQRRSMLLSCADCIVKSQSGFFANGPGHLSPLTLGDVARELGVHESTVSRAVRDKYLQCAWGVYPMGSFFARRASRQAQPGGQDVTSDASKALLKALIAGENPAKPLSDQAICLLMEKQGCRISRRTVAKYRDELGIPCTAGRRRKK